jgi:protein phosphatase
VLGDIDQSPEIDTGILGTVPGDRWMLCSDGLSSYVSEERIRTLLADADSARDACDALVEEALDRGAPDNVTAIVVDIDHGGEDASRAAIVGAAAEPLEFDTGDGSRQHGRLPALLLHPLRAQPPEASFVPDSEDYLDALVREDRRRVWRRRLIWLAAIAALLAALVVGVVTAYRYTQTRYYVGFDGDRVAIFQGVQASIGPVELSHVVQDTDLTRSALSGYALEQIDGTISADSLAAAQRIVENAREGSSG